MQLGENLQTTCLHCGSVFRITPQQLEMARGQARCNQCDQVFNALFSLENYVEQTDYPSSEQNPINALDEEFGLGSEKTESVIKNLVNQPVSLNEAMYGDGSSAHKNFKPLLWIVGILLLIISIIIQVIYYQRYPLLSSAKYQPQILNLCQILPCDEDRFSSLSQIRLIERHVFSHPTRDNALMITGSFINQASFNQPLPTLLISLSDIQGNLIANRQFQADEYLADKSLAHMHSEKAVQFRLEIFDPGTEALTYEFEFIS